MKGFTKDKKFIPMTDYKKVTRKSRDPKAKTQGVRFKKTNVSSIKAGDICFCGRTSVHGGLCPSCRDNGVFFEKQKIEQAQRNPKNVGSMQRNARDSARRVKNKHGTFIWNPRSFRVSQVVKIKDITGRHGNEIGTSRVAITEADSSQNFKDVANNPPIINGKVIGVVRKGEILNKRFEVVAI